MACDISCIFSSWEFEAAVCACILDWKALEQGLFASKRYKLIENYEDAEVSVLVHTWWARVGALQEEKHKYLTLMWVFRNFSLVFLFFIKKNLPIGFPVR